MCLSPSLSYPTERNSIHLSFPPLSSSASPSPSPSGDGGGTSLSPLDSNATTTASRFLKHGGTYGGRVATRVIELADASVAVLITADNWSKWALVEPRYVGDLIFQRDFFLGGLCCDHEKNELKYRVKVIP